VRFFPVALVGLWIVHPPGLRAQDADLPSRVDPATLAIVQPILDAAARDSLPVEALESKILEGVAKNVAPDRIGRVVSELATELRSTRSALRATLPDQPLLGREVVAAATAFRQGVGIDRVRTLWSSRPNGGSLEVPLTVLAELVRRGVPVPDAVNLMTHVVSTSVPLPLTAQIPGKFDGAIGAGASPAAALVEALRALNIPNPPGRRPNG
jgi:hypothetical protein